LLESPSWRMLNRLIRGAVFSLGFTTGIGRPYGALYGFRTNWDGYLFLAHSGALGRAADGAGTQTTPELALQLADETVAAEWAASVAPRTHALHDLLVLWPRQRLLPVHAPAASPTPTGPAAPSDPCRRRAPPRSTTGNTTPCAPVSRGPPCAPRRSARSRTTPRPVSWRRSAPARGARCGREGRSRSACSTGSSGRRPWPANPAPAAWRSGGGGWSSGSRPARRDRTARPAGGAV